MDGDLWEQAWIAVITRGATNQDFRKVKGHATKEDVEAGTSIAADKEGNDKSDANADGGVEIAEQRAGRPREMDRRRT